MTTNDLPLSPHRRITLDFGGDPESDSFSLDVSSEGFGGSDAQITEEILAYLMTTVQALGDALGDIELERDDLQDEK